jgi:restriction system protein
MSDNKRGGPGTAVKVLAWLRRRRMAGRAYQGFMQAAGSGPFQGMSWYEFKLLAGDVFRLQGYSVGRLDPEITCGGADLLVRRGGKTLLVAYRQWNVEIVGPEPVHDLRALIWEHGADGGMLLTLGRVSPLAKAAAQGAAIDLLDGTRLVPILHQAQATRMADTSPAPLDALRRARH